MLIKTGIRYDHRKVYRLIGRDLCSASLKKPFGQQEYTPEKENVLSAEEEARSNWRVVIVDNEVCLTE